jgi:hypothetical protein
VSDAPFLKRILLACSRGSARLFRNNNGVGWVGKSVRIDKPGPVHLNAGDVVIRAARPLHAGLIGGSGDLIGWRSFVIQPEDVGRRVAVFCSIEAKEGTGRMSPEQRNFRDQVLAAGGIAGEVRSVEDAERLLAGE